MNNRKFRFGTLLVILAAMTVLCSCTKKDDINLIEKIPDLKGEWLWNQTTVGGVVGYIIADQERPLIIDFKDHNTISIKCDDETIVRNAYYSCKEVTDSPYGKYLITLPKDVRGKVAESLGITKSNIVVDGYIYLDDAVNLSEPCLSLFITDVEGRDVGYEGGSDFHFCSLFTPNRFVLH